MEKAKNTILILRAEMPFAHCTDKIQKRDRRKPKLCRTVHSGLSSFFWNVGDTIFPFVEKQADFLKGGEYHGKTNGKTTAIR